MYALKHREEEEPGFGGSEEGVFDGLLGRFKLIFDRNR
jgi:hypothetical protein